MRIAYVCDELDLTRQRLAEARARRRQHDPELDQLLHELDHLYRRTVNLQTAFNLSLALARKRRPQRG